MLKPFSLLGEGLAWYSIEGSLRELRQMAQVSAQISQDHIATAFHFLAMTYKVTKRRQDSFEGLVRGVV